MSLSMQRMRNAENDMKAMTLIGLVALVVLLGVMTILLGLAGFMLGVVMIYATASTMVALANSGWFGFGRDPEIEFHQQDEESRVGADR